MGASFAGDPLKARLLQRADQHFLGKAAAMGHEEITACHWRAITVQNIQRRYRPGWGDVSRLGQFVLGDQRADRLQVREKWVRFDFLRK